MPGKKGADHRSSTTYQPADPLNPRTEKPFCFRPFQSIAEEVERRRETAFNRQDYLTLLVAYALTATAGLPLSELLPALKPYMREPQDIDADARREAGTGQGGETGC